MSNYQSISPQFIKGVRANIAFWRKKTVHLSDTNDSLIRPDFLNLLRAIQLGTVHPSTRLETAELICQVFFWVEQTGQWDSWLPLMNRLISKIEDETMCCRLYRQQGQLYRSKQNTDEAIAALHTSAQYAKGIQNGLMLAEAHLHLSAAYFDNVTLEFSERSCEISDFNSRISRLFFVGSPLNTNLMIAHQLSSLRQSVYGMKIYLTSVYAGF